MHIRALLFALLSFFSATAVAHIIRQSYPHSLSPAAKRQAEASSTLSAHVATTLHQHHEPRAILDTCVYLDTSVISSTTLVGLDLPLDLDLRVCLCLSALPLFLETNIQLSLLTDLLGKDEITAALTALINSAPGSKHCTYPQHSKPECASDDPCGFSCDAPLLRQGAQCVCKAPYTSCNGQCGSFPHGCGSAVPRAFNTRTNSRARYRV